MKRKTKKQPVNPHFDAAITAIDAAIDSAPTSIENKILLLAIVRCCLNYLDMYLEDELEDFRESQAKKGGPN